MDDSENEQRFRQQRNLDALQTTAKQKKELRLGGISYLGILACSYLKYSSGEGSLGGLIGTVDPNSETFSCHSRCKRRVSS